MILEQKEFVITHLHLPHKIIRLAQLPFTDCRIGSDTVWRPYDTSPGSPETAWLLRWAGNSFDCPIPPQVLKSRCNDQGKGTTPSPINCSTPTHRPRPPSPEEEEHAERRCQRVKPKGTDARTLHRKRQPH